MLNRTLITVKAKQPFLDWCLTLPGEEEYKDMTLEEINSDASAYLVAECDYIEDIEKLLKKHFAEIFESELLEWWTNEADWPAERTYKMFGQWFEIEAHTEIRDLCEEPLEDDKMEYEEY